MYRVRITVAIAAGNAIADLAATAGVGIASPRPSSHLALRI